MKILIQVGSLGNSVIDHLFRPLSKINNLEKISIVCRYPGPEIPRVKYQCPPQFLARFTLLAFLWEFLALLYLAISDHPTHLAGYKLLPHGLMALLIAKLTHKPIIVSLIAGPVELYGMGSLLNVDLDREPGWLARTLLKVLGHCNLIIVNNSSARDFLISHDLDPGRVVFVPQVIDLQDYYPIPAAKTWDVISLGRLDREKHVEIIIQAIDIVRKKYGEIKTCIVGDGPSRSSLVKLASDLELPGIEFAGFQTDTRYYYNRGRIFIIASEREGGPLTFIEALACGTPVISSRCGVVPDIGQSGSNCIIIDDYRNADAFADAIIHLLTDQDLYRRISQNALLTSKSLTLESVARKWESLLFHIQGN